MPRRGRWILRTEKVKVDLRNRVALGDCPNMTGAPFVEAEDWVGETPEEEEERARIEVKIRVACRDLPAEYVYKVCREACDDLLEDLEQDYPPGAEGHRNKTGRAVYTDLVVKVLREIERLAGACTRRRDPDAAEKLRPALERIRCSMRDLKGIDLCNLMKGQRGARDGILDEAEDDERAGKQRSAALVEAGEDGIEQVPPDSVTLREIHNATRIPLRTLRNKKKLLGTPAVMGKAHEYRWSAVLPRLRMHFRDTRDLPEKFPDSAREAP